MEREKLIEELAKAVCAARDDEPAPELVSAIRAMSYRGIVEAILARLDSLGLCVVPKEASEKGPTSSG